MICLSKPSKILILVCWLAVFNAHAAEIEISAPWQCDQTYETVVPLSSTIKIKIDTDSGKISSADLDNILSQANQEVRLDFFDCVQAFAEKATDALMSSTYARVSEFENSAEQKAASYIEKMTAEYGAKSFRRAAVSPFEPGEASRLASTEDEKQWLEHEISFLCGQTNPGIKRRAPRTKLLDGRFISENLPKLITQIKTSKSMQPGCLRSIATTYLDLLLDAGLAPNQCDSNPEICRKRNQSIQKVVSSLAAIDGLTPFFSKTDAAISSCQPDIQGTNQALGDLLASLETLKACVALKPDESAAVYGDRGSGVSSRYSLSRLQPVNGKPTYRATLNVKFVREGAEFDEGIHQYYAEKANRCLSSVQDKLRGPGGEVLSIQLSDDATLREGVAPQKNVIRIAKDEMRDNSGKWSPNSDCPTITHELFHLLGLTDEYEERSSGVHIEADGSIKWVEKDATLPKYDCRIFGPKDSLMASQWDAIKSVLPGKTITTCQCTNATIGMGMGFPSGGYGGVVGVAGSGMGGMAPVGAVVPALTEEQKKKFEEQMAELTKRMEEEKGKCLKLLESIPVNTDRCPSGTTKTVQDITFSDWESNKLYRDQMEKAEKHEADPMLMARSIRVAPKAMRESLLYPAQFRAITEPGCSSNRVYYSCAKEAYKTSRAVYGSDRCNKGLSKECSRGGAAWLK
ncbi:MAG: hypothetical protein AABZ06_05370 [Bdellovibrionota bacterium]